MSSPNAGKFILGRGASWSPHRSWCPHNSSHFTGQQVHTSPDKFSSVQTFSFFKGVRIQSRRSSWSWRPQWSWDTTVGLMCWCADDEQVALIAEAEQMWIVVLMQSRPSWRGAGGGARRCQSRQKKRQNNTCTQIKINHKDRQYMCM